MRNINLSLHVRKIACATTTMVCLFCCIPQQGLSALLPIQHIATDLAHLSKEVGSHIFNLAELTTYLPECAMHISLKNSLAKSFENLAHLIDTAPDSHEATTQFFQSFIGQINAQNSTNNTVEEACHIIKQNMNQLSLPDEYQKHLSFGLDIMQTKEAINHDNLYSLACQTIYWPWEWNWFGLNKKEKKDVNYIKSTHAKIGMWEVVAFALFCCAVVLVALFAPAVLSIVVPALTTGAEILL
jgi:hypothetical protein